MLNNVRSAYITLIGLSMTLLTGCAKGGGNAAVARKEQPEVPPLINLVARGDSAAAMQMISAGKVDVNARDERGGTALYCAALGGRHELIRALVEHGAEVNVKCVGGETPLMAACGEWEEYVKYLVEHGASVNLACNTGETPLVAAIIEDSPDRVAIAKFLVASGARTDWRDERGKGLIDYLQEDRRAETLYRRRDENSQIATLLKAAQGAIDTSMRLST